MIKLSVIIVMFNEFELVQTCFKSIYKNGIKDMEVILSDNSTDKKGHKKVISRFPKVKYIQNKKDLGFAAGVNAGIKSSKGEFILIFTPDMYLLPQTIEKTLKYIGQNLNVGLVGCRIMSSPKLQEPSVVSNYPNFLTLLFYYNMPFYKIVRRVNKNFQPQYASRLGHKKIQEAKAVSGQYMLIRRKALEKVGNFDPRFFLYFEDIDLCKRLNDKGWKVVYLPVGGAVQNGISDWKENVKITQAIPFYMTSLYRFFKKHKGDMYARTAWFVATISAMLSVPYLFVVLSLKKMIGQESQAEMLLPVWVKIVRWNLRVGFREVF